MGTRSLTVLKSSWPDHQEIAVLYRQMDGYPTGHGADLKEFLQDMTIVNGIGLADFGKKIANGGDCLAAQIVAHFKTDVGRFYLYPAHTRDIGEDYIYTVTPTVHQPIHLKVENSAGAVLYDGLVEDFDPKAVEEKEME